MTYAIVKVGGKQHRVREGERLLVDRIKGDEGAALSLTPLLVGGNGDTQLAPDGVVVTARVVQHVLGEKIRIGKYKKRTGYRRHTGFRSRLTQIEIESIGGKPARARKTAEAPAAEEKPKAAPKPRAAATKPKPKAEAGTAKPRAAKPKAEAAPETEKPKPRARRTTTKKDEG